MIEASVIIPVYNNWEFTRKCLKSLAVNTPGGKVEVVVIDNASSDATPKGCIFLGRQLFGENFQYVRNEVNRNFAGASNQGAELARGEFLIFLNNDTEVQSGWYEPLIKDFATYPDIAATGPMLVYPDETPLGKLVQHLGVFVTPYQYFAHLYEKIPVNSPLAKKRRFFQIITAASMIIRKQLFMEAGKFDERFINGFEDVDLCVRLSSKGYRMTINPDSIVVHHESMTPGRHEYEEANRQLIVYKTSGQVIPDWHIHLGNDGLKMEITKWLRYSIVANDSRMSKLDHLLPSMTDTDLRGLLLNQPYWQNGWLEILKRCAKEERLLLCHAYPKLFQDIDSLFALAELSDDLGDYEMRQIISGNIKGYDLNPELYNSVCIKSLKQFETYVLPDLSKQISHIMRNSDEFFRKDYPEFVKKLKKI